MNLARTSITRTDAKAYARVHLTGVWAAALTWQELLGQIGGAVRRPMLGLSDSEKEATRRAFESCGLKLAGARSAA